MFLLVNTKETHKTNKRLVYNITSPDDRKQVLKGVLDGDIVELTLKENYTNSSHKFVGSYNKFMPKCPYSFTIVDALGITDLQPLKSTIDFKIVDVKVVQYADPCRPQKRHFVAVDGPNGKELVEAHAFRYGDTSNIRGDNPHNSIKTAYNDPLAGVEFIIPAGGAVVPIVSTDNLLTKEYFHKQIENLATIDTLQQAYKDEVEKQLTTVRKAVQDKIDQAVKDLLGDPKKEESVTNLLVEKVIHRLKNPKPCLPPKPKENEEMFFKDDPRVYFPMVDNFPSGTDPKGMLPPDLLNAMLDKPYIHTGYKPYLHNWIVHPLAYKIHSHKHQFVPGCGCGVGHKELPPIVDDNGEEDYINLIDKGIYNPDTYEPEPEDLKDSNNKPVDNTGGVNTQPEQGDSQPSVTPGEVEEPETQPQAPNQGTSTPDQGAGTLTPDQITVGGTEVTDEPTPAPVQPQAPAASPAKVVYWGVIPSENPSAEDIKALPNSRELETLVGFEFDPGSEEDEGYCALAYPTSFGKSPKFINRGNGFTQTPLYVQTLQIDGVEYRLEIFEYSYDAIPLRLS